MILRYRNNESIVEKYLKNTKKSQSYDENVEELKQLYDFKELK